MKEQAAFVKRPRTIEELRSNNTIRELREYRIVKKMILETIICVGTVLKYYKTYQKIV